MELYLVRHTSVANTDICYGQLEVPLKPSFKEEAELVRTKLPSADKLIFYSSPLKRCSQLAELLSDKIITDNRIQEVFFGSWEGSYWSGINRHQLDDWANNIETFRFPNGESYPEFYRRVTGFLKEVIAENKTAAIITHAGCIKIILSYLFALKAEKSAVLDIKFGQVISLTQRGSRWVFSDQSPETRSLQIMLGNY